MKVALYTYLTATLLIALRMGWAMRRLDRFDWEYGGVWTHFGLMLTLWPLGFFKPRALWKSLASPKFQSGTIDFAARARGLAELRENPPPCGARVRYRQNTGLGVSSHAVFPAEAVETALTMSLALGRDQDILSWVSKRVPQSTNTSEVPDLWWGFQYVAADLLRRGCGEVTCGQCGKVTSASRLRMETISVIGQSFHEWFCDCDNLVFMVDGIRVHRRSID